MPSIYAHNSFGKEVYKQLPKDLKKIIQKYPYAFQAGLQGPDFLFFYRPFVKCSANKLGHSQHNQPFYDFLSEIRPALKKKGKDSGEYAYMIGFICHFMLDSECHTYVNKQSQVPGYNHLVMEIEFDRNLMKKDGKNPFLYPIWKHINWDRETLSAIHGIYSNFDISKRTIRKSLKSMSFCKWFFTTGRSIRRVFIRMGMAISLHYRQLEGQMMDLVPKLTASKTNPILSKIYQSTIKKCAEIISDFDSSILTTEPLNERFRCTFKSNEPE